MAMWIVMILVVALGVPFTLFWWKQADKWADSEHRRLKDKPDTRDKVVIKPNEARRN